MGGERVQTRQPPETSASVRRCIGPMGENTFFLKFGRSTGPKVHKSEGKRNN